MFNLKKLAALLVLSAAVTVGATGCGGDDSEDAPAPAPVETTTTETSDITKDELISQGDDICAEVNAAVGTISSSTTADESIQSTQISDIYSGMAVGLEALGTPTDGEAPTEVIDAAEELADSGESDGASALAAFQSAATEYGFSECGDAPAAPSSSSAGTDPSTSTTPVPTEPVPTEPAPAAPAAPVAPPSGGGVAPAPPSTGGDSGTSGGSSGGIGPG